MTYGDFASEATDPDRVEGISQLNAALANVEEEQRDAAGDDRNQMPPVNLQGILLAGLLNQHVFAGEDQPEGAKHGVEDSLSNVA